MERVKDMGKLRWNELLIKAEIVVLSILIAVGARAPRTRKRSD